MKKLHLLLTVMFLTNIIQAQKLYLFEYQNKDGLVNKNAEEVAPPLYDYTRYIDAKKTWILIPSYKDEKTSYCLVSELNGEKKYYNSFFQGAININDEPYSLVKDNKSYYLWSEITDKKITLNKKYDYPKLQNVGKKYILCSYSVYEKVKLPNKQIKIQNKTKGKIPHIIPVPSDNYENKWVEYIDVLSNNDLLSVLLSGQYNRCLPLLNNNDNTVKSYSNPELSGLLFSKENVHTLYDVNLKKVTSFTKEAPKDKYDFLDSQNEKTTAILTECSKLLKSNVVFNYPAYPNADPSSDYQKKEDPKPYFTTENKDGSTILAINHPEGYKTKVLSTKAKVKTRSIDNPVEIQNPETKETISRFYVDLNTGKVLLPEKYAKQIGLNYFD